LPISAEAAESVHTIPLASWICATASWEIFEDCCTWAPHLVLHAVAHRVTQLHDRSRDRAELVVPLRSFHLSVDIAFGEPMERTGEPLDRPADRPRHDDARAKA
jgi:hypothetical protein